MILVLLGTQNNSFQRLLEKIQKCIDNGIIKDEVVVQAGCTKYDSDSMKIFDFISQEELDKKIDEASLIITHGGVGTIVNCVKKGKKVIAVPRLKKFGEHVNDHQLQIIESFSKQGFIIGIKDVSELEDALNRIKEFKPNVLESNTENIIKIIEEFIDKI